VRFARIENGDARVVGVDPMRAESSLGHRVRDGPKDVGDLSDPISHRRARNVHALAFEALFDAVERLVVVVLADDDVGEKSWPRQSAFDDGVGNRRYHNASLLARARVLDPRRLHTHERCGSVVELLGRLFADRMHCLAAA
jgi:hypothetical protein